MELNKRIISDVTHVQLVALLQHVGVFLHHEPANVGKKEATVGVVRVC